ncbi:hypothetical protein BC827DRAFT_372590 [Russula dissimulans]|nr:hypothetical protein BC827DRAFT_372590 [Russula dissimulans]
MLNDRPTQTPRRRIASDSVFLTPPGSLGGRTSTRCSPLKTPIRGVTPNGRPSTTIIPKFTPDQYKINKVNLYGSRRLTPDLTPPHTPRRSTTDSPAKYFPAQQRFRTPSTIERDPSGATMIPRRPRDRACPTVDLIRVLAKCWDDYSQNRVRRAVKDGLLNGRCEPEEITASGSDAWDALRSALNNLWGGDRYVELRHWIMKYKPDQSDDAAWYSGEQSIGPDDESIIADPYIHGRPSDPARMGFSMCMRAYTLAVSLVEALSQKTDLQLLVDFEINPFFILYACADARVPMPSSFSKEFLWKFLDSIVRGQCWLIFGEHDAAARKELLAKALLVSSSSSSRSTNDMYDPEGIVHNLMAISHNGKPSRPIPTDVPACVQQVNISTTHWLALGPSVSLSFRHALGPLEPERAAPFAVLDVLTRMMKTCAAAGGTLEIHSDDMLLLWGIYEQPTDEWLLIKDVSKRFRVNLRAKFVSSTWTETWVFQHPENRRPPRDPEVVGEVLKAYLKMGDNDGARRLAFHLGLDIPLSISV